jgi:hypothetical protein
MCSARRTKASRRAKRRQKPLLRQARKAEALNERKDIRVADVLQLIVNLLTIISYAVMAAKG